MKKAEKLLMVSFLLCICAGFSFAQTNNAVTGILKNPENHKNLEQTKLINGYI